MNTDNDLIWGFAIDASEGKWEITSLAPVSAQSLGVALEPLKTAEKSEEVRQQPVGGFGCGLPVRRSLRSYRSPAATRDRRGRSRWRGHRPRRCASRLDEFCRSRTLG